MGPAPAPATPQQDPSASRCPMTAVLPCSCHCLQSAVPAAAATAAAVTAAAVAAAVPPAPPAAAAAAAAV